MASPNDKNPLNVDQLSVLVTTRKYTRQKVTKICSKIDNEIDEFSSSEKSMLLNKCKSLLTELNSLDKEIFTI